MNHAILAVVLALDQVPILCRVLLVVGMDKYKCNKGSLRCVEHVQAVKAWVRKLSLHVFLVEAQAVRK